MMSNILRSDLFRNFLGGFAIGAVALFVLQPDNARAFGAETPAVSASIMESATN